MSTIAEMTRAEQDAARALDEAMALWGAIATNEPGVVIDRESNEKMNAWKRSLAEAGVKLDRAARALAIARVKLATRLSGPVCTSCLGKGRIADALCPRCDGSGESEAH